MVQEHKSSDKTPCEIVILGTEVREGGNVIHFLCQETSNPEPKSKERIHYVV